MSEKLTASDKIFEGLGSVIGLTTSLLILSQIIHTLTTGKYPDFSPVFLFGFLFIYGFFATYGIKFKRRAIVVGNSIAFIMQLILIWVVCT